MRKSHLIFLLVSLIFLSKTASAQTAPDTPITHYVFYKQYKNFPIRGRVIGTDNLELLKGVVVTNVRTHEKTATDSLGFYTINAAKDDTLLFESSKYSKDVRAVKHTDDRLNVILINKKADALPPDSPPDDVSKAQKADDKLLRILERDAKLEGRWNY